MKDRRLNNPLPILMAMYSVPAMITYAFTRDTPLSIDVGGLCVLVGGLIYYKVRYK